MNVIPPLSLTAGSFTRSSSATYFNSSGLLATAGTNVLRINYNSTTLICAGVLLELSASTNVLLYCRDLSNVTNWTQTNITRLKDQVGIDGSANTASSLLATSSNATILQTVTLAASSRLFSAYIKRLVGSGTVSMTNDNGVTWTDITSQINGSTYTRVTATPQLVTNPVIGFKISTSGDKIAVDYCQNEQDTLTMPILTTTVAVTRSPDVITTGITSNVAEPYTGETVYANYTATVGDIRIVTSVHRKYQALNSGAMTQSPVTDYTNWIDIGPTNKWAMFDVLRNSDTVNTTDINVVIKPASRVDSIALLQLTNVTRVCIIAQNPAGINYTNTYTGSGDMVIFDIPPYIDNIISIVIQGTNPSCGACVVGKYTDIGTVQNSAKNDVLNFSTVDRDTFGNANLIQRRNVPKTSQTILIESAKVGRAKVLRDTLNASPAIWAGLKTDVTSSYSAPLLILGIYKNFSITLDNELSSTISLELEEI